MRVVRLEKVVLKQGRELGLRQVASHTLGGHALDNHSFDPEKMKTVMPLPRCFCDERPDVPVRLRASAVAHPFAIASRAVRSGTVTGLQIPDPIRCNSAGTKEAHRYRGDSVVAINIF